MIGELCLGLTLPLVLSGAQPENLPAGWRVFTSKAGAFAVALPGDPVQSKRRVMTAAGTLDMHLFLVTGNDDAAYVVSYSDLPPAEIKAGNEDQRLDFAGEGAVANARGKLRRQKKVTLDGYPGRELVIEAENAVVIRMRIFAVKQRLFQVMAMGPGAFAQSKDAHRFLDSLHFIK